MMKIMDERFGAEIVTEKGKIYKFDSAECMLRYSAENPGNPKHVLVTHINVPKELQDAKASYYVICKHIPSPMGANLSSYPNKEFATTKVMELGGETYSWDELSEKYSK
jgi:copper chaperone NosL